MISGSLLSDVTTGINALSNLLLVSPQNTQGYQSQRSQGDTSVPDKPLLFHYEGEQSVVLQSDITDHYVENNTAIQDHWALRPEVINTHGFIGELNNVAPEEFQRLKDLVAKTKIIGGYAPQLTAAAAIAYNEAAFLYQIGIKTAGNLVSTWQSINSKGGLTVIDGSVEITKELNQTLQQQMFQNFYIYWRQRTLFTVQTPWAVFQNMAIRSLRAIQDAHTNVITDFEVSFKMIRTATTVTDANLTPLVAFPGVGPASLGTDYGPVPTQPAPAGMKTSVATTLGGGAPSRSAVG